MSIDDEELAGDVPSLPIDSGNGIILMTGVDFVSFGMRLKLDFAEHGGDKSDGLAFLTLV